MDETWRFAGSGEEAESAGGGSAMESAVKEEREGKKRDENRKCYKVGAWVSMAVGSSMLGGLVFGWWELQFHPKNRQLWMVPFGLVLMIAPIFVMLSLLISCFCTSMDHNATWAVPSSDHVIHRSVEIR